MAIYLENRKIRIGNITSIRIKYKDHFGFMQLQRLHIYLYYKTKNSLGQWYEAMLTFKKCKHQPLQLFLK